MFTVGEACLQKEERLNRTLGPPKWYWGRFFFLGGGALNVSNDFSE